VSSTEDARVERRAHPLGAASRAAPAGRMDVLDYARAIAMASMIWAHYGPALQERSSVTALHSTAAEFVKRLATPGFMTVFGLTCGAVLFPRWRRQEPRAVRRWVAVRIGLLAACVLLLAVPGWVVLAARGSWRVSDYLFACHSVLTFYALAVFTVGCVFAIGRDRRVIWLALLGGGCWILFQRLRPWLAALGPDSGGAAFARLMFVTGKYAYFTGISWVFLMIPVGASLRARWESGGRFASERFLLGLGLALTMGSALTAHLREGLTLATLRTFAFEDRYFDRFWNFGLYSGAALVLAACPGLAARAWPRIHALLYPLALAGRHALPIYVVQELVLSWITALRELRGVRSSLLDALLLGLGALVGIAILARGHRRDRARRRARAGAGTPDGPGLGIAPAHLTAEMAAGVGVEPARQAARPDAHEL
jgi:hypothetical protein